MTVKSQVNTTTLSRHISNKFFRSFVWRFLWVILKIAVCSLSSSLCWSSSGAICGTIDGASTLWWVKIWLHKKTKMGKGKREVLWRKCERGNERESNVQRICVFQSVCLCQIMMQKGSSNVTYVGLERYVRVWWGTALLKRKWWWCYFVSEVVGVVFSQRACTR